jgi:hypothetical protein
MWINTSLEAIGGDRLRTTDADLQAYPVRARGDARPVPSFHYDAAELNNYQYAPYPPWSLQVEPGTRTLNRDEIVAVLPRRNYNLARQVFLARMPRPWKPYRSSPAQREALAARDGTIGPATACSFQPAQA